MRDGTLASGLRRRSQLVAERDLRARAERELRTRCEARLDELGIHPPYTLPGLLERVQELRGRPLRVLPLPADGHGSACSGMWVETADADYVLVDDQTSESRRQAIVVHELSHILWDHPADVVLTDDYLRRAVPTLDPDQVRTAVLRAGYDTTAEREAEMTGSLLLARAGLPDPAPAGAGTVGVGGTTGAGRSVEAGAVADVSAVLDRLARALGAEL